MKFNSSYGRRFDRPYGMTKAIRQAHFESWARANFDLKPKVKKEVKEVKEAGK